MAASREEIMGALLALLKTAYPFTVAGRRNRSPETICQPGQTALILLKHHEFNEGSGFTPQIGKRTMNVLACCYFDASNDQNAVPDTIINNITDAIEAVIRKPDSPIAGRLTLGGRCHGVRIVGQIDNAPGDTTGKGLAIIPIEILLP